MKGYAHEVWRTSPFTVGEDEICFKLGIDVTATQQQIRMCFVVYFEGYIYRPPFTIFNHIYALTNFKEIDHILH